MGWDGWSIVGGVDIGLSGWIWVRGEVGIGLVGVELVWRGWLLCFHGWILVGEECIVCKERSTLG